MNLTIISGRSGSGKSTALNALEDAGFNCIDNFPVNLLPSLVEDALTNSDHHNSNYAVCIDARTQTINRFPEMLAAMDTEQVTAQIIYLDALTGTLVKRFSETRRRHPLSNSSTDLLEAIEAEKVVLRDIADLADLTIDTTAMIGVDLADAIHTRVAARSGPRISVLFRSFGYKFGVPVDADLVFDIRCLPNPHWVADLRSLTGQDARVVAFLEEHDLVHEMFGDIAAYLERWIPRFEENNRAYMTVAIGCTGGQHRSVYMVEKLGSHFGSSLGSVLVRHREMPVGK